MKCKKCNEDKIPSKFYPYELSICKQCKNKIALEWRKNNKEKDKSVREEYRRKNKDKINDYNKEWYKIQNPWDIAWRRVSGRCNCKTTSYRYFGVKNLLTKDDIKQLWFRDKAFLLKKPSIDRIDTFGHYTLDNCRFIEMTENYKRERRTIRKEIDKKLSLKDQTASILKQADKIREIRLEIERGCL